MISFYKKISKLITLMILVFSTMYLCSVTSYSKQNVYTVAQDGTGNFGSICEAVFFASDNDIILIMPGIYEESVNMAGKNLTLRGAAKEACILRCQSEDYFAPPLNVTSGNIENMTIMSYRRIKYDKSVSTIVKPGKKGLSPDEFTCYSVHCDSDESKGKSLRFLNCDIVSECNNAVGLGIPSGFSITFENCRISSEGTAQAVSIHDLPASSVKISNVNFINTVLSNKNTDKAAIQLVSYFPGVCHININQSNLTVRNCDKLIAVENKDALAGTGIAGSESFFYGPGYFK